MKKYLILLIFMFPLLLLSQGVEVIDELIQKNNGTFPVVNSYNIKGGMVSGPDKDAFPAERRTVGMYFSDSDDSKVYQLVGGIENSNWVYLPAYSGSAVDRIAYFNSDGNVIGSPLLKFNVLSGLYLEGRQEIKNGYLDFTGTGTADVVRLNGQRFLYADRTSPYNSSFGLYNFNTSPTLPNLSHHMTTVFGFRNFTNASTDGSVAIGVGNGVHSSATHGSYLNVFMAGKNNLYVPDPAGPPSYDNMVLMGIGNGNTMDDGSGNNIILGMNLYNSLTADPIQVIRNKLVIGSWPGDVNGRTEDYCLIYGDMAEKWVNINGNLNVSGSINGGPPGGVGSIFTESTSTWNGQTNTFAYYPNALMIGGNAPDSTEKLHVFGDALVDGKFEANEIYSPNNLKIKTDTASASGVWDYTTKLFGANIATEHLWVLDSLGAIEGSRLSTLNAGKAWKLPTYDAVSPPTDGQTIVWDAASYGKTKWATPTVHDRSHAMTSTSDHTAGNWKVFYSNGSGQVQEVALGDQNFTLISSGPASAPSFSSIALDGTGVSRVLPGARGGTNNGFMDFTGPTTTLKTFTLPNASATILTTNAAVTVGQGGTGATSFGSNYLLTGNSTSAIQAEANMQFDGSALTVTGSSTTSGTHRSGNEKQIATNNITFGLDIGVNGGDMTSTATTFNLLNSTVTTLNLGGAATTVEIGAATGTTSVNNSLAVDGQLTSDNDYGELYDPADVIATASATTYYTLTGWTSGDLNDATYTSDSLLVLTEAGTYLINWSMSFTHSVNNTVAHICVFKNNTTELTDMETERKIGTGGDLGNVGGTGLVVLSANDKLSLRVKADNNGNLTVNHGNFNAVRIK